MSKADNLKDFLIDLANAIREKKNKTGAINPQDFSSEILSIIAGDVQMPNVSGTLVITEGITEDDYEALKLVLGSNITIDAQGGIYIHFADPEVLRVILANGVGDGTGITTAQAEAVTSIGTWFKENTVIENFDEFEKFTGVKSTVDGLYSTQDVGYSGAFSRCTSLKSISLPNELEYIGSGTFSLCEQLDTTIPQSVTQIGSKAFYKTSLSGEIYLPILTKASGQNTFSYSKIEKINFPLLSGKVDKLAAYANELTDVISLGRIVELADGSYGNVDGQYIGAFMGCKKLLNVHLPDTLEYIGSGSFAGCTALKKINIPKSVKTIKVSSFYKCTSLEIEDLSLPNLTALGKNAFYGVKIKKISNLGKLTTLPNATTSTQNFGDKNILEELVLPQTITSIPNGSFYKYTNCVIEDLNLPNLTSLEGGAFNGTKLRKITSLGEVTRLPGNTNNTGGVFEACIELRQIQQSVLDKLEYIATAFQGCVNLEIEDLRLPNLTEISAGFANCNKIRRVMDLGHITRFFGETELSPNTNPFGTTVELIVLPESVESIGRQAFRNTGNSLKAVILKATTPPSCALYWDNSMPTTLTFYVPDASVEAYKTATSWSQYSVRIKPLSEYEG